MNCEQFQERMDALLDRREDVTTDAPLLRHAADCSCCRQRLAVWSQISDTVASQPAGFQPTGCQPTVQTASGRDSRRPRINPLFNPSRRLASVLAMAAGILVLTSLGRWLVPPSQPSNQSIASAELPQQVDAPDSKNTAVNQNSMPSLSPQAAPWQSGRWWSAMADEQWVHHTIPAVDSVRQGVAPIGRSMRQAVAILLIQSNATSIPSAAPKIKRQPLGEQTPSEQTSTTGPRTRLLSMA